MKWKLFDQYQYQAQIGKIRFAVFRKIDRAKTELLWRQDPAHYDTVYFKNVWEFVCWGPRNAKLFFGEARTLQEAKKILKYWFNNIFKKASR